MENYDILVCVSCGEEFVFPVSAQEYYHSLGYEGKPKRCKACYRKHKQETQIKLRPLPGSENRRYSRAGR